MKAGKRTITTLAVIFTAGFVNPSVAAENPLVFSNLGGTGPGEHRGASTLDRGMCEWLYDDGMHEDSIGLADPEWDITWSHWWDANELGCGWVTSVQIAWGACMPDTASVIYIFNDPNNDRDPSDILVANDLLASINVLSEEENTGTFIDYPIGPVAVDEVFFVTVVTHGYNVEYPAAMDKTLPAINGVAWLNYYMDPEDPWAPGGAGPILMENIGRPCEWMIRAIGTDEEPQENDCPWDCDPDNGGGSYGNGKVNIDDLFAVLGHWGDCVDPENCPWDCHPDNGGGSYGNGKVNIDDLFAVLGHWGPCPSTPMACCFDDGTCQDLTELECIDVGGVYYGQYGTCAEFSCPQPPPNDACEYAREVQIGSTITGDTTGMANPFIDGCVGSASMHGPTLWYYVIGDGTALTATLCVEGTADWDHVMSVFCGSCASIMDFNLYCAGGSDVDCVVPGQDIWAPEVQWCTEEGIRYWIAIYGPAETPGNYGQFAMSVTSDGLPCDDPPQCTCELDCSGAQLEQELCGEDTNGGCNTDPNDPHSYEEFIQCDVTVCGTVWSTLNDRDTDWYLLEVEDLGGGGAEVTITFNSQFSGLCGVLPDDCNVSDFTDYVTTSLCEEVTLTTWMWAGNNVIWVGPSDWFDLPCGLGNQYKFSVQCEPGEAPVICQYEEEPYCHLFWEGATGISSTSSDEANQIVADDFTFLTDTDVNHLCWWGLNGHWLDPGWEPGTCNTKFRITFYNDDGDSCPSSVHAGPYNVDASCEDTGVFYLESFGNVHEFTAFLPQTVTFLENECYWVEIVDRSVGDADYFLWTGSQEGQGTANFYSLQDDEHDGYQCDEEYIEVNRSLCMGLGDPPVGQVHGDEVICAPEVPFDGCQDYGGGAAANSDENGGYHIADDFLFLIDTTIDELRFWGVDYYFDGAEWLPCYNHNTEFHVTYYEDSNSNGCPDNIVAEFDVEDAGVDSGFVFNDATVYLYTVSHNEVTFTGDVCYWVEVTGLDNDDCWFNWISSNDLQGDGIALNAEVGNVFICPDDYTDYDLAWCMANNGLDVTLDDPTPCINLP